MRLYLSIAIPAVVFLSGCSDCSEIHLAGDASNDHDVRDAAPDIPDDLGDVDMITWARSFGTVITEHAVAGEPTSDGGYIVAGNPFTSGGGPHFLLVKLDAYGTILWQKAYDGPAHAEITDIHETADNGFILAGAAKATSAANSSFIVIKLDSEGSMVWNRMVGGENTDYANAVSQTRDGGYIAAGWTNSFDEESSNSWVVKLDSAGDIVWEKCYSHLFEAEAVEIRETMDNGFFIAGHMQAPDSIVADFYAMKLDRDGDVIWSSVYRVDGGNRINAIDLLEDGGCVAAGSTFSSEYETGGFWVISLSSSGSIEWNKAYGGAETDAALAIEKTRNGGYIAAGVRDGGFGRSSDIFVLKLDQSGEAGWGKSYGGGDFDIALSVRQTVDGGYVITGQTLSFGAGSLDYWVLKVDEGGNIHGDCPPGMIDVEPTNATEIILAREDVALISHETQATVSELFFYLQGFSVGSEAQCE